MAAISETIDANRSAVSWAAIFAGGLAAAALTIVFLAVGVRRASKKAPRVLKAALRTPAPRLRPRSPLSRPSSE
jgi:hypothetical protein